MRTIDNQHVNQPPASHSELGSKRSEVSTSHCGVDGLFLIRKPVAKFDLKLFFKCLPVKQSAWPGVPNR